jgi:hypothetical protein
MLATSALAPKSKTETDPQRPRHAARAPASARINPAWARLALGIQRKLSVSTPDDPYEREADDVADKVMRRTVPQSAGPAPPTLARKCEACDQEDKDTIQTSRTRAAGPASELDVQAAADAAAQRGAPLPAATRAFFEPRFGADFGHVRIHTDTRAAVAARSIHARAFTAGREIVFASGEFAPESNDGRRLLAHELTHVIQQTGSQPRSDTPSRPGTKADHGAQLRAQPAIMPYRSKDSANFGACDTATMVEKPFNMKQDKDTLPWIEKITVHFDGTANDSAGNLMPTGSVTATYFANPKALAQIKVNIVGGQASEGLTDEGLRKVTRIEGCGYHHTTVPKAEQITAHPRAGKYYKDTSKATMNFAVFFIEGKKTGNQAIHQGDLNHGSLACVHVGNANNLRQLNYHSVVGHTQVEVSYGASAKQLACCARFQAKGVMVSNPCKGEDPKKCPP